MTNVLELAGGMSIAVKVAWVIVLLWTGDYLPNGAWGAVLAALPLLASSYQFCRVDAKTDDHFFLGFPSYWNVVAFYVFILDLGTSTTAVILVACTVLVFVPIRYVYVQPGGDGEFITVISDEPLGFIGGDKSSKHKEGFDLTYAKYHRQG